MWSSSEPFACKQETPLFLTIPHSFHSMSLISVKIKSLYLLPLWYTSNIFSWEIMHSNSCDIPMPKEICWQMGNKSELSRPELTIKTSSPDWWWLLSTSYTKPLRPKLTVTGHAMATKTISPLKCILDKEPFIYMNSFSN